MAFFISRKKFDSEVLVRIDQIIEEMGADLHDSVTEKLYVLGLYIDRIEQSCNDPMETKNLGIQMKVEYEKLIRIVQDTFQRLRPVRKEGETLVTMLEALCREMEHPGVAHIHFTSAGVPIPLREPVEIHTSRIVQELIQNAFRHSSAWHIWVRLLWQSQKLVIEVEDDGIGFSRTSDSISKLKRKNNTLKMRTHAIAASIDYSRGKKGLIARVELPLGNSAI